MNNITQKIPIEILLGSFCFALEQVYNMKPKDYLDMPENKVKNLDKFYKSKKI